ADDRGDAARVLLEAQPLVSVANLADASVAKALEEHRLEQVLREVQERRRRERERVVPLPFVGQAAELFTGEGRHPRYVTAVLARRRQLAQATDVDARATEDLERPRIHHVSLWRSVRSLSPLDDETRYAETRKQDRSRETD